MDTVYCQSGRGDANLTVALEAQLEATPIRGKNILLKPNMVDPSIPKACSDPRRMQLVVDVLRNYGAATILIGDEPAHYVFGLAARNGSPFDVHRAYHEIGYATIRGAELIDLKSLPLTSYQAIRVNPVTVQEETLRIPIRNTKGLLVISFTLPKHHGNYNYSGVVKNLMGLVPEASRKDPFHYFFYDAVRQSRWEEGKRAPTPRQLEQGRNDLIMEFVHNYTERQGEFRFDPTSGTVPCAFNAWINEKIDFRSLETHLEHIVNAGSLVGLVKKVKRMSPGSFFILDGTYLLTKQEHDGIPVQTDFAVVGKNPAAVDKVATEKLGIDINEVPYLMKLLESTPPIKQQGEIGSTLPGGSLLGKEICDDSHGLPFSFVA